MPNLSVNSKCAQQSENRLYMVISASNIDHYYVHATCETCSSLTLYHPSCTQYSVFNGSPFNLKERQFMDNMT